MKSKEIRYFEWEEIQSEICKEMNIDEQYFRDYHKLIGGDYKDLWHEWMNYFGEVRKDTIVRNILGECMESKLEWIKENGKEWLESFVKAVYKVWDDNEIEYVRYFW
jgi:hypothetical protein